MINDLPWEHLEHPFLDSITVDVRRVLANLGRRVLDTPEAPGKRQGGGTTWTQGVLIADHPLAVHSGFPAGPFGGGGDSPPPNKSVTPPNNFY